MILYFANRKMEILGHASTNLKDGFKASDDLKTEEVETGVAVFECDLFFDDDSRIELESMAEAGNYLLRSHDDENEFYTIIDTEIDTKDRKIYIYAEDAGLDLINEVVGAFEATEAHTADWYINKYTKDSGFEIGINEIPADSARKLSWEGEATVTERLASIATQFGGFEVSYSFSVQGMEITHKYINIYEQRGKDVDDQLRLNKDINRIITKKSVANLATALYVTGGTPEGENNPITLNGYEYDDGDFYVDGKYLKSRNAVAKWSRYVWEKNTVEGYEGHIVKRYSYDTTEQKTLCSHAVTELKKICDTEVNYEVDIAKLPDNIKIGDRINIVDDRGELYLSTRILKLETSVANGTQKATLGEYLIRDSGISQKVQALAEQFQELAQNRVLYTWIAYADDDQGNGISLDPEGKDYMGTSPNHTKETPDISDPSIYKWQKVKGDNGNPGEDGRSEVSNVTEYYLSTSSTEPTGGTWSEQMPEWESGKYIWKRNRITWSDGTVTYTDPILDTALNHANEAADYATGKAEEAATAAGNAQASATIAQGQAELSAQASADAQESANTANTNATDAINKANAAQEAADEANAQVTIINGEISSIKEDQTDIRNEMSAEITTIKETMEASYAKKTDVSDTEMELRAEISKSAAEIQTTMESDYAKKTELTAVQSNLQTQITQNAQEISSTASAVETVQIDATEAQSKAEEAVQTATEAQNTAQTAVSAAQDAQESADAATLAAQTAQSEATKAQTEANTAKQAAEDAKAVADAAQTDLDAAKQNLTNVTSRVDATEEEIAAAQAAVDAAQQKADEANASAAEAQAAADEAQASADTAKQNAATAQATADTATANAAAAQTAADEAKAEADKANAAVGNLANTVTDMQTQISQNAEAIELAATKTEVQEYLSGYSTKEETESAINLASSSIRAEVNASIGAISGGDNILRGTNVETELVTIDTSTWETGQWKLRGTGTATSYIMTDSPVSSLNIAWTIKGAAYPAKYGGIQQTQITIEPGTYTVSVWAKNTSADSTLSAQLAFYLGNGQIGSTISVGKNWGRYSATFSVETESITIAFYNPSSITSTDICGMTLNKGETASPWTPSTFDIGDDLTAIRASLELKVDKTALISEINASANVIRLTGNRFVVNSDNFSLTQDGTMTATNGTFNGSVNATSITAMNRYSIRNEENFVFARLAIKVSDGITTGKSVSRVILGKAVLNSGGDITNHKGVSLIAPVNIYSAVSETSSDCTYSDDDMIATIDESGLATFNKLAVSGISTLGITGFTGTCRPSSEASGDVDLGSTAYPWYNLYLSHCVYYTDPPSGGGTAIYINSNGALVKYSSDRRLKNSIEAVTNDELNPERLYELPIWQYKYNDDVLEDGDDLKDKTVIGFMADEVASVYPRACAYDKDGVPTSWNPNVMIPAMLALIQKQKQEIEELRALI